MRISTNPRDANFLYNFVSRFSGVLRV